MTNDSARELLREARGLHASDCALHNAPALPVGPCDCGLVDKVKVSCGCYKTGCECGKFDEAASDGYDHGWNDAIDAIRARITALLSENADGWISVEDRLPDSDRDVLIFVPKRAPGGYELIYMASLQRDGNLFEFLADGEDEPMEPSHRRELPPLPTPPKNGGK